MFHCGDEEMEKVAEAGEWTSYRCRECKICIHSSSKEEEGVKFEKEEVKESKEEMEAEIEKLRQKKVERELHRQFLQYQITEQVEEIEELIDEMEFMKLRIEENYPSSPAAIVDQLVDQGGA